MNKKVQFTHEELEYIKLKVVGYDARLAKDEGKVKELQIHEQSFVFPKQEINNKNK